MTITQSDLRLRRQWFWPVSLAALIILVSHRGDVAAPSLTGLDKGVHFSIYGLLATLICRLGRGWRTAAWALLLASAFGATDEWHQSFVPGRFAETADWVADTLGAAAAVVLYRAWPRYRGWLERPVRRNRRIEIPGMVTPGSEP